MISDILSREPIWMVAFEYRPRSLRGKTPPNLRPGSSSQLGHIASDWFSSTS